MTNKESKIKKLKRLGAKMKLDAIKKSHYFSNLKPSVAEVYWQQNQ